MPILIIVLAISEYYPDIAVNENMDISKSTILSSLCTSECWVGRLGIGIFYLSGKPILRCERGEAISGDCFVVTLLAMTAAYPVPRIYINLDS